MESNLWIELAESMLEILRRIVELENDEQTQVSDEMIIPYEQCVYIRSFSS